MSSAEGLLLNVVTNYDRAMEMFVVEKATGEVIRRQMVQDSAQVHFDTNVQREGEDPPRPSLQREGEK